MGRHTTQILVDAARKEFQQHGFGGTDTNKIARRAGFFPRAFYRWFEDKRAICLAVYTAWVREEFSRIAQRWDAACDNIALLRGLLSPLNRI
jgi:AcrR family transcriptional regulator